MITKQNERIMYRATSDAGDYQITANVVTQLDATLLLVESGAIAIDGQNIADFSLSPDNYLMLSCYDSNNTMLVTEKINDFINELKEKKR